MELSRMIHRRQFALLTIACLIGFLLGGSHQAFSSEDSSARDLVTRWIQATQKLTSLEAEFRQERQLKTLRKPLIKSGRLWFKRPDGFRWQIDEPPALIAVRAPDGGGLKVADMKARRVRLWSTTELQTAADASNGGGGFSMFQMGFSPSIEEFEKMFEISSATPGSEQGQWNVHLTLKDSRARLAVKDIVFTLRPDLGALDGFEIQLRDGSILRTLITRAMPDAVIANDVFMIDTNGFSLIQD